MSAPAVVPDSIDRRAKVAGRLYFLMGLIAPIGLLYVPGQLIVARDATATAERIRASAWLLRVGIASELIHQAIAIFVVLALYRLFKDVDERLAKQMVVLGGLVSVPITFLNVVNEQAALTLLGGADFLAVFEPRQLDALAYLFLRLHDKGIIVASIFWGLWLFPFGRLIVRSGYFPRILGFAVMVAGLAYVVNAFTVILLPQFAPAVGQVALILELGELPIIFWLAFRGVPGRRSS